MNPILTTARSAWMAAADFRSRRDRCKRYTYGDQWSDFVRDDNGNPMPEFEFVCRSGRQPLTNNMIRQLVKVVVGRYRAQSAEQNIYDYSPSAPSYITDNALAELDCRLLEEFLISGTAIQRIDRDPSLPSGITVDNVDPRMFFVNPYRDPRGRDIRLIGMLHDLTLPEIMSRFGDNSRRRNAELAAAFSRRDDFLACSSPSRLGCASEGCDTFDLPQPGYCRVVEVWTLDCAPSAALTHDRRRAAIVRRKPFELRWHCRWFATDGTLLASYDSPYAHGSHPFALKMYPLTDGEIHSFVEDVIDQQRFINRLIVLVDHMLGTAAKGVLLFPYNQKPDDRTWEEIGSTWAKSNGVIPIKGLPNAPMPKQVVTSVADSGAYQMLSLQMKLLDNISGISDAVAGRTVSPSTGNALYENQLRSSIIALADLLDAFAAIRSDRDHKSLNL